MTFTDYLIDISLIALVLFQVRGRRLTTKALLLPLGIVGYVAYTYLRGVPTAGNDLFLVAGCAAVGATLGGLAGRFTSVYRGDDGLPFAKAGLIAAALWVLGTGCRLAFQVYASPWRRRSHRALQRRPQHHECQRLDGRPHPDGPQRSGVPHRHPRLAGQHGPPPGAGRHGLRHRRRDAPGRSPSSRGP